MRVSVLEGQTDISKPNLGDLQTMLDAAMEKYRAAEQRESIARQETTDCRNEINGLQKKIDAAFALLKQNAPRDSDWRRDPGVRCG